MAVSAATISFATKDDIPALAQIITEGHGPEAVMAFSFKDWPATTTILPLMTSRISLKIADLNAKVIKITDDATNEILGLTAITLETGGEAVERDITSISNASGTPPPGMNWEFAAELITKMKTLDELMAGKKHYGA
jgi:hypothetical protein